MKRIMFLVLALLCSACQMNKATTGALGGGALGAGAGAIIGSQTGHAGAGTAIGAAAGALTGALVGNALDQQDKSNQQVKSKLDQNQATIDENRRLIEELKAQGADVYATNRGVVVNLPDVLFEFNRADLTSEARKTVGDIAKVIGNTDRNVSVEGHTDSIGTVMYNKKLSVDRAENTAKELERHGVSGSRLRVRGFGEGNPIATNNTPEGRARNRRVEVIVENRAYERANPVSNPDAVKDYNNPSPR